MFGTLNRPFGLKISMVAPFCIDSESELRKIGSQAKKIVLKDFAGKFVALFFIGATCFGDNAY